MYSISSLITYLLRNCDLLRKSNFLFCLVFFVISTLKKWYLSKDFGEATLASSTKNVISPEAVPPSPSTALLSKLRTRSSQIPDKKTAKPRTSKMNHVEPSKLKRRTRSGKEIDQTLFKQFENDNFAHVHVLVSEVLDVFAPLKLHSFVDCTLGAAGYSSAIIQAHPEMNVYVGLDIDPIAHEMAQNRINDILHRNVDGKTSDLQVHTFLKNFRQIKPLLNGVDEKLIVNGVDGILMDLGMSSMQVNNAERGFSVLNDGPLDMRMNAQASLKAEDILNSWPEDEVGKILRDYGEENNWYHLQKKIVKARANGGLRCTSDLVGLIRSSTYGAKGSRQGRIKTATRVFQALRIAVNDELNTLTDSVNACFSLLTSGGRLAVISFHSLEDRIVKQTFLDIINSNEGKEGENTRNPNQVNAGETEKEAWIRLIVRWEQWYCLNKETYNSI